MLMTQKKVCGFNFVGNNSRSSHWGEAGDASPGNVNREKSFYKQQRPYLMESGNLVRLMLPSLSLNHPLSESFFCSDSDSVSFPLRYFSGDSTFRCVTLWRVTRLHQLILERNHQRHLHFSPSSFVLHSLESVLDVRTGWILWCDCVFVWCWMQNSLTQLSL